MITSCQKSVVSPDRVSGTGSQKTNNRNQSIRADRWPLTSDLYPQKES